MIRILAQSIALALALSLQAQAGEEAKAPSQEQQGMPQAKPAPPPPPPSSFIPPKISFKERALATFAENDKFDPPKSDSVVFIGGAQLQNWLSLTRDMAPLPIANRGVGGTSLSQLIELYNLGVSQLKPKILVCYCGDDDLSSPAADPKKAFQEFKLFIDRVKSERPSIKIVFISVKASPRQEACLEVQRKFNLMVKDLSAYDDNLTYLDASSVTLGPDGKVKSELFKKDGISLNNQGYDYWSKAVKAPILKLWTEVSKR